MWISVVQNCLKFRSGVFAAGLGKGLRIGVACAAFVGSVNAALAACKPSHFRAAYFIRTLGPCQFDIETMSFRGTAAQQAMCLMRGMDATRNLAPALQSLPAALTSRMGETSGLPTREALSAYLSSQSLEWDFAATLWRPIAHARDNDPDAPAVKYFVIHDTSGPYYGSRPFPDDLNVNPKINNLQGFACADEWGKAHIVLNRMGDMLVDHDFSVPWRETKFEQAAEFGGQLKGLFVHIEMIQPRRAGGRGDNRSPDPAFTPAQYDRLALLYTIASVRAGHWLVPAFHAALDADIRNGHDDPLNFNIDNFADSIEQLNAKLSAPAQLLAAKPATTEDSAPNIPSPADGIWISAQWDRAPRHFVAPAAVVATDSAAKANVMAAVDPAAKLLDDTNGRPVFDSVAAPSTAAAAKTDDKADAKTDAKAVKPDAKSDIKSDAKSDTKADPKRDAKNDIKNETKSDAVEKAPPANAKLAARESEPERKHETVAEECTTRRVKGHRRRICEPVHVEHGEHGEHGKHARSADRDTSHGHRTSRHHGDSHERNTRSASRRGGD